MYDKILHLIHTPRFSGAEMLVRDLCLIHQNKGIGTAIASFNPAETDFTPALAQLGQAGTRVFLPGAPCRKFARSRFYRAAIDAFQPDIVYAHSVFPALYGRLALPLGKRPRFVSVLHNASNDDYAGRALHVAELLMARRGDEIVTVSELAAHNYRKRIPHHLPVRVIPNGTDLARIRAALPKRDATRQNLGLGAQDRLMLQVGRFSGIKQQAMTFDAALPLLRQNEHLHLWYAGLVEDQAIEAALKSRIAQTGMEKQVRILGGRNDVPDLLSAADLFVMPSKKEAHSVGMIEALASGAPVVASSIPAFQYAASLPGVTLVSPDDAGALSSAMAQALKTGGRFARDMDAFDINKTAAAYGGYAEA